MKKLQVNAMFMTNRDLDLQNTGGPFIPKRTVGVIKRKRVTGELLVDLANFGRRTLLKTDITIV